jgi:hypothetical protein
LATEQRLAIGGICQKDLIVDEGRIQFGKRENNFVTVLCLG